MQSQIGQYQSRVDAAPMVEQELASLTREYELEKTHYADLTSRHQQASIAEDSTRKQGGERFSVLFPANLPKRPQKPDQLRILAVAIAAGLVLGAAAAVGREFLDRSVHDARALQRVRGSGARRDTPHPGVAALSEKTDDRGMNNSYESHSGHSQQGRARRRRAAEPAASADSTAVADACGVRHRRSAAIDRRGENAARPARAETGGRADRLRARTTREGALDHRLVAALAPQSLAAEQYRSLRTRISSAENGRANRAIIVTSPGKGDGKSLTAANLALTMAQEFQHRVLLIDADLRRPTLHRLFGFRRRLG